MSGENTQLVTPLPTKSSHGHPKRCLVQYSGVDLGRVIELTLSSQTIGRALDNEIHLRAASVSRQHARIASVQSDVLVEDLGSANGTFLNGEKVDRETLKNSDFLRFGGITLKYVEDSIEVIEFLIRAYERTVIDPTTQTYNSRYLKGTLASEFEIGVTYLSDLSIIAFDLDNFKKVNDEHGHNVGDQILLETSQIAKQRLGQRGALCRSGGEEFVVVLPQIGVRDAYYIAEKIRLAVANHRFKIAGVTHKQTMSAGVAELNGTMKNVFDLTRAADERLYKSKTKGRNRVTV